MHGRAKSRGTKCQARGRDGRTGRQRGVSHIRASELHTWALSRPIGHALELSSEDTPEVTRTLGMLTSGRLALGLAGRTCHTADPDEVRTESVDRGKERRRPEGYAEL